VAFTDRDVDLRHLLALDAVATAGTFGRAAERLGYTQSAVSQQIAALERAVGEPLFDRPGGPRPVQLTPLGKVLLTHGREVIAAAAGAATAVRRFQAGTLGRIDIGTFQSAATALLPPVLGALRDERPELDTRLVESDDQAELVRQLLDGRLDLVALFDDTPPEVERLELFDDPFVLITKAGSGLPDPLPITALNGLQMVGEQDSQCQREVDDELRANGVAVDYLFRSRDNSAVIAMVRAGMGVAVMPVLAVDEDDPRIDVHRFDPPIPPRRIALGWHRDRTLSPAAKRFLELTREITAQHRQRELLAV
jgi:DNA-binding transcriptional LysR family regulator